MMYLDKAPASVRGWFQAERSADPSRGRRAVLSPDVVFHFPPNPIRGVDAVVNAIAAVMRPGWLGDVEYNLMPPGKDGAVTVRGTGPGGSPVHVLVPGSETLREEMDAMDFLFTLDKDGLIASIAGEAHHFDPGNIAEPLRPGQAAPDFTLPDVDGVPVPLRQDGAKATAVIFTCNHCPYVLAWNDRMQRVVRDYTSRGVRFLQINANDPARSPNETTALSRKRVAEGQFAGPYLVDEGQTVARRWGAQRTPEIFVLDARGVVAYHGAPDSDVGDESQNAAWLRGALDHVLAGTKPDPAQTQPVGCSIKWTL